MLDKIRGQKGSLRARSLSAGLWNVGGIGIQRSLSLVSNLIMTRFLVPEDFGLMAIVITVLILVEMMSDIGIRQSIVRDQKGEDLHFLQVAWTVQILRASVIAGCVLLIAAALWAFGPSLAGSTSVYADPQLPILIAVSALGVVFAGCESVAMHVETRNLRQGALVKMDIGTQVLTLVFMIVLVQINPTVWVLLLGLLSARFIRLIWTHLAFRARPMRLVWDSSIAAELWEFGRWLIGSSMAGFIVNNGDRFIMGALLPKETFGFYVIAMLWLAAGAGLIAKVYDRVIYPLVSEKLRQDRIGFTKLFKSLSWFTDVVLFSAFLFVFLAGPILIELLYTPEYITAGIFLSIVSLRFITQRIFLLNMVVLAEGNSARLLLANLLAAVTLCVLVFSAFLIGGVVPALIAISISPSAAVVVLIPSVKLHHPNLNLLGYNLVFGAQLALLGVSLIWPNLIYSILPTL